MNMTAEMIQTIEMQSGYQCFDTAGWTSGRASSLYWSEVQMICIWSSWCHFHPIISCFIKIQHGLPFWCLLT